MPPKQEYDAYLSSIWERGYLTNNGPLVQKLEEKLKGYLGIDHLLYVSNGTIALQIAIKALGLKGDIITTPFSYVATTSSIVWEGCDPIFVDIDPKTLNINPELIEASITDNTSGILATHVFGNPCDIEAIQSIARRHDLKVIYDASHCFGTLYKGKSVFAYGNVSTTSFHATKLFHTVEGGAVFTNEDELDNRMSRMRNFGHDGFGKFDGVGINGNNSEFHAAMGLTNLHYIEDILNNRQEHSQQYNDLLHGLPIQTPTVQEHSRWNCAYYPVVFESEHVTLKVKEALENEKIYPRRYFYPSLDTLEYVKTKSMNVSNDIAKKVLCLPLYFCLKDFQITDISKTIIKALKDNQ